MPMINQVVLLYNPEGMDGLVFKPGIDESTPVTIKGSKAYWYVYLEDKHNSPFMILEDGKTCAAFSCYLIKQVIMEKPYE